MKLIKLEIYNFKSIGYAILPVDEKITTLVGANEHGKTNLLSAFTLLDFKTPIKESDKRISKNSNSANEDKTKIIYEIVLSEEEVEELQNELRSVNSASKSSNGENQKTTESKTTKIGVKVLQNIKFQIGYHDGQINTNQIIEPASIEDSEKDKILDYLRKSKCGIFYFETFKEGLKHRIPREEIINKSNDITNGLIKLAGLSGRETTIFEDTTTAHRYLRDGEERLTKQLKSLWIQGKEDDIQVKLIVNRDGNFLCVDIEDFNTYGEVSTRSLGFIFFLSFILKFKQYHDGDLENQILLIEEPGIFLHPRGQKDLLLYLENLSKFNQLIYTTHSPFIINRLNNFRVRVISKDKEKGTQVNVKPYNHNWGVLRASLGMLLSDSFYYADNNLIVEDTSDRLFIITLLKLFHEKGWINADLNILSIIDSGGAGNVPTMVQIIKSEERPFVVLVDSDNQGDNAIKSLIKREVVREDLKQVGDFKAGAITIEDLLPKKFWVEAVNKYIDELSDNEVCKKPEKSFIFEDGEAVKCLKEYFKVNELGIEDISKLNIARHFEELIEEQIVAASKDNFDIKDFEDTKPLIKWIVKKLKI